MRSGKRRRGASALAVTVLAAGMLAAIGLAASPASAQKALTVRTTSLPAAPEGSVYSVKLAASGGVKPYTWSIVGSLPAGLTLVPATGLIQGIAPIGAPVDDQFTVQVSDSETPAATATANLSIQVQVPPPLKLTTTSLPAATAGVHYSQKLTATGGAEPYTWSIAGEALPPGLTLQPDTGVISGSPTAGGDFRFVAQVSSPTELKSGPGTATATATLSISVTVATLWITTDGDPLPPATAGVPYSVKLDAAGGITPYTWALDTGTLPPGLKLHPATGVISGTPTVGGSFGFSIDVTDSEPQPQTQSLSASMTVASPLVISADLPGGSAGDPYSGQLTAAGGTAPYTWSLYDGSQLSDGLSLGQDGSVTGVAQGGGVVSFTVEVTDATGLAAIATETINIGYNIGQ